MADETPRLRQLQEALITGIVGSVPSAVLNGPRDLSQRVPGNVNVSFPPHEGESLVVKLDMRGFAVSSGSACHSAKLEPSAVLLALGKPEEIARSSVRFSLGRSTTQDAIDKLVAVLPVIAHAGKSGAAKATVVQ
jgi:cysteine desulfurase